MGRKHRPQRKPCKNCAKRRTRRARANNQRKRQFKGSKK